MTLIAGMCCQGAVLLAADSKGTESSTGNVLVDQSFEVEKMFSVGSNVAWGSSGSGGVSQRVRAKLTADYGKNPNVYTQAGPNLLPHVRVTVGEVIKNELANVTLPLQLAVQTGNVPRDVFLFGGYGANGPFIFEYLWDGQMTEYTAQGFHAIGSGGLAALTTYKLLEHHRVRQHSIEAARVLLMRIMDTCIRSSSGGLGPPIRMLEITQSGVRQLPTEEIAALADTVTLWEDAEREALNDALKPQVVSTVGPAQVTIGDDAAAEHGSDDEPADAS